MVDTTAPSSKAGPIDPYYTTSVFDIPYTCSDGNGVGVTHVNLYYSHRPPSGGSWGSWQQYGGDHTSSPISFDADGAEGNGQYRFYTLATDDCGHTEAAPPAADCATSVFLGLAAPVMDPEPEYTAGTSNTV